MSNNKLLNHEIKNHFNQLGALLYGPVRRFAAVGSPCRFCVVSLFVSAADMHTGQGMVSKGTQGKQVI
jgi:hypothetical protein